MSSSKNSGFLGQFRLFNIFIEFSLPLILGVVVALVWGNVDSLAHSKFIAFNFFPQADFLGHALTVKFLVNDVFMVLFFAIAAIEITRAFQPGGVLESARNAINPLLGTIGGVLGPIGIFFMLAYTLPFGDILATGVSFADILRGWGIPTATDIALAWLATTLILGRKHPAIAFLLLLAIVDDAIGLVIIAVFYPSPTSPVQPIYLLLIVVAIVVAIGLRRAHVHNIWAYIVFAGFPSWLGLLLAHLHPALAFVVVIPFMPDTFPEHVDQQKLQRSTKEKTPSLTKFERVFELPVDLGLFFFGLVNAGVAFASINMITWLILLSLLFGKTIGIWCFSMLGTRLGYPLPTGITPRSLLVIAMIAGMGLTVALFITGEAYTSPVLQNPAKMGALFSVFLGLFAYILTKIFKLPRVN